MVKLGIHLPRTLSAAISSDQSSVDIGDQSRPVELHDGVENSESRVVNRSNRFRSIVSSSSTSLPSSLAKFGNRFRQRPANNDSIDNIDKKLGGRPRNPSDVGPPQNPRRIGRAAIAPTMASQLPVEELNRRANDSPVPFNRTIRFPDDNNDSRQRVDAVDRKTTDSPVPVNGMVRYPDGNGSPLRVANSVDRSADASPVPLNRTIRFPDDVTTTTSSS